MSSPILARAVDQVAGLLDATTPDNLSNPTPCSDWTVADLADHVVNSTAGMVAMAQGGEPDWASSPHHDDPAARFGENAEALLAAVADGGQLPEGMAVTELAVHSYDLATALGRSTADLDAEVAETGHAFMSEQLTDDRRGDAFGPAQPAPEGADAYQRLAALSGRTV